MKTLFFINGPSPTEKDLEEKSKLPGKVCFRNIQFHKTGGFLESCDFVAGCFPSEYSNKEIKNEQGHEEEAGNKEGHKKRNKEGSKVITTKPWTKKE